MTNGTGSTLASTAREPARVVPLTRVLRMSRRFPRTAALLARHFPDTLSLLGGALFLAIAVGGPIYGGQFLGEADVIGSAVAKVLTFSHPYGR